MKFNPLEIDRFPKVQQIQSYSFSVRIHLDVVKYTQGLFNKSSSGIQVHSFEISGLLGSDQFYWVTLVIHVRINKNGK